MYPEIITQRLLACFVPYDDTEIARQMSGHNQTLHLLDSEGNRVSPLFASFFYRLPPYGFPF